MSITPFIGLVAFFLYLVHRQSSLLATSFSDYLVKCYALLLGQIILSGWIVSAVRGVNDPMVWGVVSGALAASLFLVLQKVYSNHLGWQLVTAWRRGKDELLGALSSASVWTKVSASVLLLGVLATAIVNVAMVIGSFPNEWDSMTGHLVKAAYYLQIGSIERVGGTIWSIDYYPNSVTTLQLYFYHLLGEKGFRTPHYLAYWAYILVVYGIAKTWFQRPIWSLFSALLAALLPTALVQGTTTETDLLLTVYVGLVVYCLAQYYRHRRGRWLYWAVLAGTMALGHKITFLMIGPSIVVLVGYIFWVKFPRWKHIFGAVATLVLGLCLFVLPAGYLGNLKAAKKMSIGALTAPPDVLAYHGTQDYSTRQKVENFFVNAGRFGYEFIGLDGIRMTSAGESLHQAIKAPLIKIGQRLTLDRDQYWVIRPFQWEQEPIRFYIERPYWGVIGFLLVFPILFLNLVTKKLGSSTNLIRILTLAAFVQFVLLCSTAPYDPIKARYFLSMSVWILPVGGFLWEETSRIWRKVYGVGLAILIIWAGLGVVLYRQLTPVLVKGNEKPFWQMNRLEQLTISRPDLYLAFKRFDELVPANAIVALGTQTEDYEYPLWGPKLARTLLPIHPFHQPVKDIPQIAQYLVFTKGVFPIQEGDIQLNYRPEDPVFPPMLQPQIYYLRKLNP